LSDYRIDYLSLNYRNRSMSLAWQPPHNVINNYWNFPKGEPNAVGQVAGTFQSKFFTPSGDATKAGTPKNLKSKINTNNGILFRGGRHKVGQKVEGMLTKAVQAAYKIHKISALGKLCCRPTRLKLKTQARTNSPRFFLYFSYLCFECKQFSWLWIYIFFFPPWSPYFLRMCFCFCQLHMWCAPCQSGGRGLFIMALIFHSQVLYQSFVHRETKMISNSDWLTII